MVSSAEPFELADGGADGENVRGIGSDKRPLGPSDAEGLIVGETRPGETPLGYPTPAEPNDGLSRASTKLRVLYKVQGVRLAPAFELGRCERHNDRYTFLSSTLK